MSAELTATAEADLQRIASDIARDNQLRVLGFLGDLVRCCLEPAGMAEACPVVPR